MAPRIAYISFDIVPAPKGAAIHIQAFVQALAAAFGEVQLVTVASGGAIATHNPWPGVQQVCLPALGATLIDRVLCFRRHLMHWWQGQYFDVVQIRSIYEGFPIAFQKPDLTRRLIFEVNGLPSIELKYRYPQVADDRDLLEKLRGQEAFCLEAADWVITPSQTTQTYLIRQGVPVQKIQVIPNGVDLEVFTYQAPRLDTELSPLHVLYFGTGAAWQGVAIALEALALYRRDQDAKLTILAPLRSPQRQDLHRRLRKLHLTEAVQLLDPVSQPELVTWMHQSDGILAPLTVNDRNLIQGCCPLKILEGMASGTPVITSDLPVVRELGDPDTHFLATLPGSAKALKDALLRLQGNAGLRQWLAIAARHRIETHYTWTQMAQTLIQGYALHLHP